MCDDKTIKPTLNNNALLDDAILSHAVEVKYCYLKLALHYLCLLA